MKVLFHTEPPEIMKDPQDVEVSFGGTAIFTCRVEGDPEPLIVWMKDEKELPQDERYRLMDDGSLMIENSKDTDEGFYECMAKGVEGEAKSRPARMLVSNQIEDNDGYGK